MAQAYNFLRIVNNYDGTAEELTSYLRSTSETEALNYLSGFLRAELGPVQAQTAIVKTIDSECKTTFQRKAYIGTLVRTEKELSDMLIEATRSFINGGSKLGLIAHQNMQELLVALDELRDARSAVIEKRISLDINNPPHSRMVYNPAKHDSFSATAIKEFVDIGVTETPVGFVN